MDKINGGIWMSFEDEKPLIDGFYQVRFAGANDKGGVVFIVPHTMDIEHWKDCQWLKRMPVIPASEVEELVKALEKIKQLPEEKVSKEVWVIITHALINFQSEFPEFKKL